MANLCPHAVELFDPIDHTLVTADNPQRDRDTCVVKCAVCGHGCLWHTGQACDDGPQNPNLCEHTDCIVASLKPCTGYVEP